MKIIDKSQDPIQLFAAWFEEAKQKTQDATMMTLATADAEAKPAARVVLLKAFDNQGFVFYTNLQSHKAHDLRENPQAALCFYWVELDKQVRIQGVVEQVSDAEADAYFASRSRESQIGAWASKQSQTLGNPDDLYEKVKEYTEHFKNDEVSRPYFWSGFRLRPEAMEFWQRGEHRLHLRLCFRKTENQEWMAEYLYP